MMPMRLKLYCLPTRNFFNLPRERHHGVGEGWQEGERCACGVDLPQATSPGMIKSALGTQENNAGAAGAAVAACPMTLLAEAIHLAESLSTRVRASPRRAILAIWQHWTSGKPTCGSSASFTICPALRRYDRCLSPRLILRSQCLQFPG